MRGEIDAATHKFRLCVSEKALSHISSYFFSTADCQFENNFDIIRELFYLTDGSRDLDYREDKRIVIEYENEPADFPPHDHHFIITIPEKVLDDIDEFHYFNLQRHDEEEITTYTERVIELFRVADGERGTFFTAFDLRECVNVEEIVPN